MRTLTRRASSIPETTFIATTTILLILLLAALVAFIITFLRHIHRPENTSLQPTINNSRGFSRRNVAFQQHVTPQPRRPSNARTSPSPYDTTHTLPLPIHPASAYPPSAPTHTLRPYTPNIPPATLANSSTPDIIRRDALMARLATMPLTSDTTDDTGFDAPGREVMNRGYADWIARRRPQDSDPTAAMLIGSDEGTTDAGGGEGGSARYAALLARGEGDSMGTGLKGGNGGYGYAGLSSSRKERDWTRSGATVRTGNEIGSGRAVEEEENEESLTPRPLPLALRKVRSDPY